MFCDGCCCFFVVAQTDEVELPGRANRPKDLLLLQEEEEVDVDDDDDETPVASPTCTPVPSPLREGMMSLFNIMSPQSVCAAGIHTAKKVLVYG